MTLARVDLSIPGTPRGKQRAQSGQGRFFTPKETEAEEAYIRQLARRAMAERPPMLGPVKVELEAIAEMPLSWPSRVRSMRQLPHISKPDLDNVLKLVLDAMNGVVFADDCQICEIRLAKRYGEGERVDVTVEEFATTSDHPALRRAHKRAAEDTIQPRTRRKKATRAAKPRPEPSIGKRIK